MLSVHGQYFPGADEPEPDLQLVAHLQARNVDDPLGGADVAYAFMRMADVLSPVQGSYSTCKEWHDVRNDILRLALPASCMTRVWWTIEWTGEHEGKAARWKLLAGAFNEDFGFAILDAPHWDQKVGLWLCEDCEGMEREYDLWRY